MRLYEILSTFSLIIACIVKTRERFMGVVQVLTMPLFFASNAIYPTDIMPGWLKTLSHLNPLTYEMKVETRDGQHLFDIQAYLGELEPKAGNDDLSMKRKTPKASGGTRVLFLFDVDNTLLDNDRVIADLGKYLKREVGPDRARCYWTIFEQLRIRLGYADYLGALQRFRSEYPHDLGLLAVSRFLINYPFANRLFPRSLDVIEHVKQWGAAVLLSDGDVVFQPRKVDRSGLYEAVDGHALIYMHKERELADVEARYPADHYVMVDDKLRILAAIKKLWGSRVTTVFVRQGHYARDPKMLASHPLADVRIERIGDLLDRQLQELIPTLAKAPEASLETRILRLRDHRP